MEIEEERDIADILVQARMRAARLLAEEGPLVVAGDDIVNCAFSPAECPVLGELARDVAEALSLGAIRVTASGGTVLVRAPYNEAFVREVRSFGRWYSSLRVWSVPALPDRLLWLARALESAYRVTVSERLAEVLRERPMELIVASAVNTVLKADFVARAVGERSLEILRPDTWFDTSEFYKYAVQKGAEKRRAESGLVYRFHLPERVSLARKRASLILYRATVLGDVVSSRSLAEMAREGGEWFFEALERYSQLREPPEPVDLELPSGLSLYPFQEATVWYLSRVAGYSGLIIADEMGLGKTVQALAIARARRELRPLLVVAPAGLRSNWLREIRSWLPEEADAVQVVYSGRDKPRGDARIVITSYSLLARSPEEYEELEPRLLVLDESHYIKNPRAKRTRAVLALAEDVRERGGLVLLLTGTPMINSALDIFPQLVATGFLKPEDRFWFQRRFMLSREVTVRGRTVTVYYGFDNMEELYRLLRRSTVFVRRVKADVASQLPERLRIPLAIDIDSSEYMRLVRERLEKFVRKHGLDSPALLLAELNYARQVAATLKAGQAAELVAEAVLSKGRVVVFTYHRKPAKLLQAEVRRILEEEGVKAYMGTIDGATPAFERRGLVERFSQEDRAILYVNIRAGGVGLNLQAADTAIFLELDWSPAAVEQAEARLHRVGQARAVEYYYLLATGTVDEAIWRVLREKREKIEQGLDREEIRSLFLEELERVRLQPSRLLGRQRRGGRRGAGARGQNTLV